MSMLHAFFDLKKGEENAILFQQLKIKETTAWQHQGKYPVIFLSFKDVKETHFEYAIEKIQALIKEVISEHQNVLTPENTNTTDYEYLQQLMKGGIILG